MAPKTKPKTTTKINGKTVSQGSSYTDSAGRTGTVNFDTKTGNPLASSSNVRAENTATGADISGLTKAYRQEQSLIQQQQAALAERRVNEIAGIKGEFDIAKIAQEVGQDRDYGARSTSLITSGGGFLGATQSQEGVLQNLKGTFETEKNALMSKREAAILAANTAYEDKDFALAREYAKSARDYQNEIYNRQKDYADQQLALSREKRSQTEFDIGLAKDKIEAYSMMSDAEFKAQNPATIAQLDSQYYPGYTAAARTIAKKALETKTTKDAISLDADILDMRLKIPQGQKFNLGGTSYTGLKKPEGSSASDIEKLKDNDIANAIINFQNLMQTNSWAGINPEDYTAIRSIIQSKWGASAVLELDQALKTLELEVDYENK